MRFVKSWPCLSVAVAVLAGGAALEAAAQAYPSKSVRIVVPYAAGGPVDGVARMLGPKLAEIWGHQLVVENRGGAGGSVGADLVARAAPDGYTLLLGNTGPMTINPVFLRKLGYDPRRDFEPVTLMLSAQMVLVVHPSLPAKSVKELVALARAKPGQLNYASAGVGNLTHLGMELFKSTARFDAVHIPYKGVAPAFIDLLAGQVVMMFGNIAGLTPHVKAGRMRALAVSSSSRAVTMPDVPTVSETYPGFELVTWMGIFAPAGTPRGVVDKLHGDFVKVLQRQDSKDYLAQLGTDVVAGTPRDLAAILDRELKLYSKIIKSANIVPQ
jgi:tripartite-type tricarboxylate transporter receptor subunit TctC